MRRAHVRNQITFFFRTMKPFIASALLCIPAVVRAQASKSPCLRYEPDTARVSGVLTRHMYYGAPGFGGNPKHDAKEVGFYLDLTEPICVAPGADDTDVAKAGIRRVQLVLDSAGYAHLRPLMGKRVTLQGTLFAAYTGHHHTPVLLHVIKPESGRH